MSQDVFQLRMDAILKQCPGVIGIHDDMVIFGVDQQDHDANLINCLNVCQKEGLVLNSKKLELRRERVTFFGAEYSTQGMHPDPKKVQGITEMTAPTDKQQLQSFLGMVNYMGTFIPNLSHHTELLGAMLKILRCEGLDLHRLLALVHNSCCYATMQHLMTSFCNI